MINFEKPRDEIEKFIDDYIVNERDNALMKSRWLDGLTIEQTADVSFMSVRQTKRIIKKYENLAKKIYHLYNK